MLAAAPQLLPLPAVRAPAITTALTAACRFIQLERRVRTAYGAAPAAAAQAASASSAAASPAARVTVKTHQLQHLAWYLMRFGSISHTSMERFEAAHQLLKRLLLTCLAADMEAALCRALAIVEVGYASEALLHPSGAIVCDAPTAAGNAGGTLGGSDAGSAGDDADAPELPATTVPESKAALAFEFLGSPVRIQRGSPQLRELLKARKLGLPVVAPAARRKRARREPASGLASDVSDTDTQQAAAALEQGAQDDVTDPMEHAFWRDVEAAIGYAPHADAALDVYSGVRLQRGHASTTVCGHPRLITASDLECYRDVSVYDAVSLMYEAAEPVSVGRRQRRSSASAAADAATEAQRYQQHDAGATDARHVWPAYLLAVFCLVQPDVPDDVKLALVHASPLPAPATPTPSLLQRTIQGASRVVTFARPHIGANVCVQHVGAISGKVRLLPAFRPRSGGPQDRGVASAASVPTAAASTDVRNEEVDPEHAVVSGGLD